MLCSSTEPIFAQKMLPPFRVRCLQRSACSGRGIQKKNVFDALVRISAPEYDNTIRVCPEASLKYLDDDDGETITVHLRTLKCVSNH